MDTPLLATKLFVPQPRPGLIARPRLMERLQNAAESGVTLVSAPAGFGKTTVVSQWARQRKEQMPAAWVSLDGGDNDPIRFWDYFIAALKTIRPAGGDAASTMLHSAQTYPTESVLTVLINDVSNVPDDFAVVLDDYHLISSEAVHSGVAFLLDHLPPHMHLVLATRFDPPLPLARLRARGFMQEVGADDLRFTLDEAARLVNPMLQTPLSTEDVGSLNARTEGWAVGLKMAALSMRGQKDVRNLLASFTGSQRYVMDYLVEEVLKQQSTVVREFLLTTSILEKLTAPLCDTVTGLTVSQDMLTTLESLLEGFVVPLDESRRWYRYHHLFGDLLRHQLEVVSDAARVKQLHRLASEWYEDNGWSHDAIHHALEAQDWEQAVSLIHGASAELVKRGEISTLLNWLWRIPDELLRTNLLLYRQYAYALQLAGHLERAEAALNYLETADEADPALRGEVAVSQADLARQRGDNARAVELAESALALLPPDALAMRARANYILGLVPYDEGAFDRSFSFVTRAYEIGRQAKDYVVASRGLAYTACCVRLMRGDLSLADNLARQAIELAGKTPASSVALYALGEVLYERNDLEGADRNFQMACEMNELFGNPHPKVSNYYHLALTRMAAGDMDGAVEAMENSDRAAGHSAIRPAMRAYHAWARVVFSIRTGDIAAARSWGSRLSGQGESLIFEVRHIPPRLLIARGMMTEASQQLRELYEKARQSAQGYVITIRVQQALAAETAAEALAFLAEALKLGEPEGFVRTFVDEGRLLAPLLRQAVRSGIEPDYARKLLTIFEAEEHRRKTRNGEGKSSTTAAGVLSERETEVLGLMGAGLSDRQIAAKLMISLSTAKTHVHRILEKLGATSRTQAVSMARERRLL